MYGVCHEIFDVTLDGVSQSPPPNSSASYSLVNMNE